MNIKILNESDLHLDLKKPYLSYAHYLIKINISAK